MQSAVSGNKLLSTSKADMSLGEFFEYCKLCPQELDGYSFEQKIQKTISEEFVRLQGRVDGAFELVTSFSDRMMDFEQKVEVCRAQMSRIGKFDGAYE